MNSRGAHFDARSLQRRVGAIQPPPVAEFAGLARAFEEDLEAHFGATVAKLRELLPAWMADTVFSEEEISNFVRGSLAAQLGGFRRGELPDAIPEADARGVRGAARLGALRLLLDLYRVGHIVLWQGWFERVEETPLGVEDSDELLRYGCEFLFHYADRLRDHVADLYHREIEQMARSGEQRRFYAIRTLLEGGPLVGSQLDVELNQHHLGLIAWGKKAEDAVRRLASLLDRRLLLVGPLNRSWWGWASGAKPLSEKQERMIGSFDPGEETYVVLGLDSYGEEGFRATNRQALQARRVHRTPQPPVIGYADVAVEALAAHNPGDARAFVAHELRGIDDDTPAAEKIRETVLAYFAAGHNAASAAAALGVHQQTVANRLRTAEERLGHPVGSRRMQLETALRLRDSLGLGGDGHS